MKRLALFALCVACGCNASFFRARPAPADRAADSLYVEALSRLDLESSTASLDTGIALLESYLGAPARIEHTKEAVVLVRLARAAQRLSKVEAALQQAQSSAGEAKSKDADSKARDDSAVKEVQRLKDELAKANAELERIKKRLATPKP